MKKIVSLLLVLMLFAGCAFAQTPAATRPSVTVADVVIPSAGVVGEVTLVITLNNVQPETKEQKVVEEIVVHVQEKPVVEYFTEEVIVQVAQYLPPEVKTESLVMDEIFVMDVQNYETAYGDVEARFQFVTQYKDNTPLVAMVGIMNEDGTITWIPMQATVVEGMVSIAFTQDVLEIVNGGNQVIMALLRADEVDGEAPPEMAAPVEAAAAEMPAN